MKTKNSIGFGKRSSLSALCSLQSIVYCLWFTVFVLLFTLSSLPPAAYADGNLLVIGNVGIGTTDPAYNLDSRGSIASIISAQSPIPRGLLSLQHSDTNAGAMLTYMRSRGTYSSPTAVQAGDFGGFFGNQFSDGTSYRRSGAAGFVVDGPVSTNITPSKFSIYTSTTSNDGPAGYGAERLTVNSDGSVGIGIPNPQHLLHLSGGAYSDGYGWYTGSSREYKENISELNANEATVAFNKLNPVTFNYKAKNEEKHVGFIAEDMPDLIASKDRKGLSPVEIVAVLTRVVQEQQKKISELSAKVSKLEQSLK
jgi:hypothetical protein